MNALNYIPGTCNIGPDEIRVRRNGAIISGLLVVVVIVLILATDPDRMWRLVLFIPASSLGVSFLQWYLKFCVGFGLKGVFNFGETGRTTTAGQKENLQNDRMKAWKMICAGIAFGLFMSVIFYFLPV